LIASTGERSIGVQTIGVDIARLRVTLVDIGTGLSITFVTLVTSTINTRVGRSTQGLRSAASKNGGWRSAIISSGTVESISRITVDTLTSKGTIGVYASGVDIARLGVALVDIGTGLSISGVTLVTSTINTRVGRSTNGLWGARSESWVRRGTVVDGVTRLSVTAVVLVTFASERSNSIGTSGVFVAVIGSGGTLINIGTGLSVSGVTLVTGAGNTRVGRSTNGLWGTRAKSWVRRGTVVDGATRLSVSGVVLVTGTSVRSDSIGTSGVFVARSSSSTLVDVGTGSFTISSVSSGASASERSSSVLTNTILCGGQTVVGSGGTFVDVGTGLSVSSVASDTSASVGTDSVGTGGLGVTRSSSSTLVYVGTGLSVSGVTSVTPTSVRSGGIGTGGVSVARVGGTLVDVGTSLSVSGEARLTSTSDTRVGRSTNGLGGARSESRVPSSTVVDRCTSSGRISGVVLVTGTSVRSGGVGTGGVLAARIGQTLVDVGTMITVLGVARRASTRVGTDGVPTGGHRVARVLSCTFVNVGTVDAVFSSLIVETRQTTTKTKTGVAINITVDARSAVLASRSYGVDTARVSGRRLRIRGDQKAG